MRNLVRARPPMPGGVGIPGWLSWIPPGEFLRFEIPKNSVLGLRPWIG